MANFAVVDMAKQFSSEVFMKKLKPGVVSTLTGTLPAIQLGDTSFFDLSSRTKGEVVGESVAKSPTPTPHPLRHIRTTKIQYTERFSDEFLMFDREKQLNIVNKLAQKWMGQDFLHDLDTIILHGINPLTGASATSVIDWIGKAGSSTLIPSTGDTAAAIDTDLHNAINAVDDVNGIAFANNVTRKLATLYDGSLQRYPTLGKFGLEVSNFEGIKAAQSKEVGEYNSCKLVVGNWDALKWGIAAEMPVELIRYGDPDGQGDLTRNNEVALRYEVVFGFGIADPTALAIVQTPAPVSA